MPSKYFNFYPDLAQAQKKKSPKTSIFLSFSLSRSLSEVAASLRFHYWQAVRDIWKLVSEKGFGIEAGVRNVFLCNVGGNLNFEKFVAIIY